MKFILAVLLLLSNSLANANDLHSVARQLGKHYFHELGWNEQVKEYERMYVPQMIKYYVYPTAPLLRLIVERRIIFTMRFP